MGKLHFLAILAVFLLKVSLVEVLAHIFNTRVPKQPGILIEQAAHDRDIENLPGSHHLPLQGKVKTAGQSCGFRASSGGSLEWHVKP